MHRNTYPIDEQRQKFFNFTDALFRAMQTIFSKGDKFEVMQNFYKQAISLFFATVKPRFESDKNLYKGKALPIFLNFIRNILSATRKKINVGPNYNELAQSVFDGFDMLLSTLIRKINDGGESQIQSDSELPGAILNLLGTVGSALQKKASPEDEVGRTFLSLFNTLVSGAKNRIGGGAQEVYVDTLPMYTAKHFDQSMSMESVDENATMAEGDMALSEEAKTQLWGAILSGLASGALSKFLNG